MCDEKQIAAAEDEIPILFSEDLELLEDRLNDIIVAMGLPEEQTAAVLRLVSDALDEHHANILDTFETTLPDDEAGEK